MVHERQKGQIHCVVVYEEVMCIVNIVESVVKSANEAIERWIVGQLIWVVV
jgi:hypothetical protein